MAKLISEIIIKHETRQCIVKGRRAMFHQWAEKSKVIGSSPLAGGHPGGAIKQTVGIIEYLEDGTVHECYPDEIIFIKNHSAMTIIKCDLWCKHQNDGNCNKTEIDIGDMQYIEEKTTPNCCDFDNTKAECYDCNNCNCEDNICDVDGHEIDESSKCTNGEYSCAI